MILNCRPVATALAGLLLAGSAAVGTTASASAAPTTVPPATAQVVNARFGVHPGYDRIVLDIKGPLPRVSVIRVDQVRYDPSGKPVPLRGSFFLRIRLAPAAAHDSAGHNVYRGPRLVALNLPHLRGFALAGDFEGVVGFGVGVRDHGAVHVFTLQNPNRVVMDVR
ncbi:AMIN-like domain-containing (lipo)protein [Streptacidiphilus monticola]|jgi:hypothetical protein|uniref:AMIN-like domain-containing protein n=1 Tax=Streptacidiphilus monticola TaxID=2161674 RepID=A0ABW1G0W5_9ACTN